MKNVILIPTYNEKENLPKMVEILKEKLETAILVIDDNSPDGTGKIADELAGKYQDVFVLHRQKKQGLGKAYIAGYKWAIEKKYETITQMDCDFSHDPKYLPEMWELIKDNDLVLGSRYCQGISCYNWPLSRILLSKFANLYIEIFTRLPVRDATGGFKCFRREVLEAIDLDSIKTNGYSFQVETTYRANKLGYKVKEFPIIFYERTEGKSKMSKLIIVEAFFLVLRMFLKLYWFKGAKKGAVAK